MSTFNIGDRVRLVSWSTLLGQSWRPELEIGSLGAVMRGPDRDGDYFVEWDGRVASISIFAHGAQLAPAEASPAPPAAQELAELITAHAQLGPRARKLLLALAGRLVKGAKEHGDFDPSDKRNWGKEALDEDLDAIVYRALELQARTEVA